MDRDRKVLGGLFFHKGTTPCYSISKKHDVAVVLTILHLAIAARTLRT